MRLGDVMGRWLGKMEVVLAGADDDLRAGEEALADGDPMAARSAAHRVLERAPESPLGLALLADACEAAHLDAELAMTLEQLAIRAPSRAEVWVRLARARRATESPVDDVREAWVRALAVAEAGSEARREALLGLADLDLAGADAGRAELWLERTAPDASPDVVTRLAEVRMLRGDAEGALEKLDAVADATSAADGRAALVRGRAHTARGDSAAFAPLLRALVLDTPGASQALSTALSILPSDVQTRTRIRSVVDSKGEQDLARWRAAFARAEGAREAARRALREAVASGDLPAAMPLLEASVEDRDAASLAVAIDALAVATGEGVGDRAALRADARLIVDAARAPDVRAALDALEAVSHSRLVAWAADLAADAVTRWVPALPSLTGASSGGGPTTDTAAATSADGENVTPAAIDADGAAAATGAHSAAAATGADGTGALPPTAWSEVLARLDERAHAVGDLADAARVTALATERARPLRLAVIGEFNAGKSTFINALIGADVAPTGVLPTTATLHHLRWAPDPFARVVFAPGHEPAERVLPLGELRATLRTLESEPLARVEIRMPLHSLVRVEILDTPGFNAPDARHAEAARAAFEEADMALWLLDATQAIKKSERSVLEEVERAGLPVQILVNKTDRLGPEDLTRVMASVGGALAETGLASFRPPVAFSAKRALAGRLGDQGALAQSGWAAVDALFAQHVVGRSEELKERALRRRATAVVHAIETSWSIREAHEAASVRDAAARAHETAQAAARIERSAEELTARVVDALSLPARAWARDVALVGAGRDARDATADPGVARYRVDRALATLAPALARAAASLVPEVPLTPDDLTPIARAVVSAVAWEAQAPVDAQIQARVQPIARATVSALAEALFARSSAPPVPGRASGVLRELRAFSRALTARTAQRGDAIP